MNATRDNRVPLRDRLADPDRRSAAEFFQRFKAGRVYPQPFDKEFPHGAVIAALDRASDAPDVRDPAYDVLACVRLDRHPDVGPFVRGDVVNVFQAETTTTRV